MRAYAINLDEYSNIGTHWVALYVQNNNNDDNNVIYLDSFGVETFSEYKHMIR